MRRILKTILVAAFYAAATASYNVDVTEIGYNTSNPDIVEIYAKVVRPSRGVFGMSGHINVKKDIDMLTTMVEVRIYYSSNGISFILSPFRVPPQTTEQAMNHPYKYYIMDGMAACCTNVPVADVFHSPLTKRYVECENCQYPSENFPSGLRRGFYRVLIMMHGVPSAAMWILLKVEPE